MKKFAAEYQRNEDDWIKFPADSNYRKELFPATAMTHVARANIFLVQAIVEYVSEMEETVMDIMSGSGTIMIGALAGRKVICIELEPKYVEIIEAGMMEMEKRAPGISTQITVVNADCQLVLPIPAHHIIFSPPYAQAMRMSNPTGIQDELYGQEGAIYQDHPSNVGRLNEFLYNQVMEKIYKLCFESLPTGGTLSVIIKDGMREGKRVWRSSWVEKCCKRMGFVVSDHFKWDAPGTFFHSFRRARGEEMVKEEEIIIFKKQ